jgi:hypothetical protein
MATFNGHPGVKRPQSRPPPQSRGSQVRIAYAFEPARNGVLILGGAKAGDDRFYRWFVPKAERCLGAVSERARGYAMKTRGRGGALDRLADNGV